MLERLVAFMREYQNRVREATALFREHKRLENPAHWRLAGLEQRGFIDAGETIAYRFHGRGCRVILPLGEVDWDFAPEGLVGLEVGFLSAFAKRGTGSYPEFRDWGVLSSAFQEAISQGLLRHYPEESFNEMGMYFLQSDTADK